MTDATALSFSEAYDRLKEITDRLNAEDVEPDELVPLLRDGKGLESALRANLEEVEQEVQAIESGKGVTPYRILSATAGDSDGRARGRGASDSGRVDGASPAGAGSDDDIPF